MSVQVNHRRDSNAVIEAVTPAVAELGFDTTRKDPLIGDGATLGGIRISKKNARDILVAAQLVANTNNYSPAGLAHAGTLVISTDASRNITGLVPLGVTDTLDGREITIYNAGSFNAVIQDQNASSTAANRFDLGGADIALGPKQSLALRYRTQGAVNRWELAGGNYGQAISDASVSARKLASSAFGLATAMINGTIVESHAGSAVTFALKTLAGTDPSATDPVYVLFRNATAATGDFSVLTVTAATSLTISSGSSMGVPANNTAFRLWLLGFNDAGTFRLGAVNCLSGGSILSLNGFDLASSTAEGGAGAADSAQVFYTGTAVASKPYSVLGYASWETGLAATGTWSASPTRLQLYGAGVPLPAQEVGRARQANATATTGTTVIPHDNTIPQNTEGDQYLSQAITVSSGANLLEIGVDIAEITSSVVGVLTAALFQDATANALAASAIRQDAADGARQLRLAHVMLAGAAGSTTFKVRAGSNTAGTTTFNGNSGSGVFNGVCASSLHIKEIMA